MLKAIEDLQVRVAELERQARQGSRREPERADPAPPTSAPPSSVPPNVVTQTNGSEAGERQDGQVHGEEGRNDALSIKGNRTKFQRGIRQRLRSEVCRLLSYLSSGTNKTQFPEVLDLMIKAAVTDPQSLATLKEVHALQKRTFRSLYQTRRLHVRRSDKTFLQMMEETVPSRKICDDLVQVYFTHWEKEYRVVHVPSFCRSYQSLLDRREAQQLSPHSSFLPLLTAVMAVAQGSTTTLDGSLAIVHPEAGNATAADRCEILHEWLYTLPRKQRLYVSTIQVEVLLLLAEQTLFTPSDILWQSMGSIVRTAMTMGLHCDVSRSQKLNSTQKEVRTRLWISLVELDLQLSMATGMAPLTALSKGHFNAAQCERRWVVGGHVGSA